MKYSFYIDESGNTGTDWINNEQPYFVYGGWLVCDAQAGELKQYLSNFFSKTQATELKAKKLFKQKKGILIFNNIFKEMCYKYRAFPIFCFVDKKFMIAGKIVETFFDGAYNPRINWYLTTPVELKKALAVCISENDEILIEFSKIIKNCTASIDDMKKINQKLIKIFEKQNHIMVADTLRDLKEENFLKMIDEFESVTKGKNGKNNITLTGTTLVKLLNSAESICRIFNGQAVIVHDKLRGYNDVFLEIEKIFLKKDNPVSFGTEKKHIFSNFPHVDSITTVDSKSEILVQAADLLCGFVSKVFKSFLIEEELSEKALEILYHLIKLYYKFIEMDIMIWDYHCTYEFEPKLCNAINSQKIHNQFDYHKLVDEDFINAIKS
ncbi:MULTISPECIES: DUF3800 domain-containing protein [Clostridium]|uniref:DUF3800 domain-containing protein n=1 Tax=Clostridium TaxID=1485 RepID=UPI0013FEC516|nr:MULTISPECIES: DUF3800 domain-containing protein [Clostridium]MBY6915744.1 DUF3800 domain-containing protein [Clostridium botulinum]NFI53333.1 DUF3800 domain-containing protein [Clostridium botulinum]NFO39246.1 DUF3800 domain-containing protein [Clostridium botulinum]NFQ40223.1 DUF3800 domain-containing protein [Clostridium botulinum]